MRTSLWLWLAYLDTVYLPQSAPYMTLAKPTMSTQLNTLKSILPSLTRKQVKYRSCMNAITRTVPWSEHISEGLAFTVSAHQMLYSYTKTL